MQYIRHNCRNFMLFHRIIVADEHGFFTTNNGFTGIAFQTLIFGELFQNAKSKISSAPSRVSGVNDSKTGTLRARNVWRRKRENYWRFLRPGEIVKESFLWRHGATCVRFDCGVKKTEVPNSLKSICQNEIIVLTTESPEWLNHRPEGPIRPRSTLKGTWDTQATSLSHPFFTSRIFARILSFPKNKFNLL